MAITKIQTVTVGSGGAASIDFTSIPQTYTDLLVVLSGRSNRSDSPVQDAFVTVNGSSSGYSTRTLYGIGSGSGGSDTGGSTAYKIGNISTNNATSNTFGNTSLYFPNYSGSTNKSLSVDAVSENNASLAVQQIAAGLWANTSAITSISIFPASSNTWVQYSSATLYGITKGSSGGVTVS